MLPQVTQGQMDERLKQQAAHFVKEKEQLKGEIEERKRVEIRNYKKIRTPQAQCPLTISSGVLGSAPWVTAARALPNRARHSTALTRDGCGRR